MKKIDDKELKKFALSERDSKVLNAIRNNDTEMNTGTENTYRLDNRFRGSSASRRNARLYHRRNKE